ncbi:MAG TPA: GNAT family N-acetyltransferase [Amycolatopsis sp.]|uniref:GNAT family N-acetyltransferase n=1 Tax=Amycolatopsis sp. TaxID=37632 RepID=UPI002B4A4323|nr:GNAT family N-acetyltransferase [Amycolatopsis sp.]HKS47814.1 GNAT family N-acetyltransferase [Amycolatopsis sp.]
MTDRPARVDQLSVQRESWEALSSNHYDRIMAIREEAFPPAERFDEDTVALRNSTWLWTARADGDQILGFASALLLATARVAYLEYLAVDSAERGRGIGAAMLSAMLGDLRAAGSVRGIVVEVEDPVRTPGNDPLLARRIGFYGRWGAKPVGILNDYSMPDLVSPGDQVPMIILWRGIVDGDELGAPELTRVLTDLYRGYYASAAQEGHLEEMIRRIR